MARQPLFADTDPRAEDALVAILREMTPSRKLELMFELNGMLRRLQTAETRKRYPNADDREVFLRVTARRIGLDLVKKAYGWEPDP